VVKKGRVQGGWDGDLGGNYNTTTGGKKEPGRRTVNPLIRKNSGTLRVPGAAGQRRERGFLLRGPSVPLRGRLPSRRGLQQGRSHRPQQDVTKTLASVCDHMETKMEGKNLEALMESVTVSGVSGGLGQYIDRTNADLAWEPYLKNKSGLGIRLSHLREVGVTETERQ